MNPDAFLQLVARSTSSPLTCTERGNNYRTEVSRPHGLFGLVRERSPTGGADLEDFQWIDDDDRTEGVLMVQVSGEDGVIFRRRLSTEPAPAESPPPSPQLNLPRDRRIRDLPVLRQQHGLAEDDR